MELRCSFLPADAHGLSDVARRALSGRPHPPGFDDLTIPAKLADLAPPPDRWDEDARGELADALTRGLAPFQPHVNVLEAVRALGRPGTAVVLAGQQPGFLGGPLLNLHKAAHAARLARALSEAWDRPVVAGFWNHSDDHDLAEVHHLWIQNPELDLRKVGLSGASSGRDPLSSFLFHAEHHRLGAVRELLRQNLWEGGPRDEALETFLPRHGETFGEAFGRTMLELFGEAGLIVFEPRMLREPLSRALAGSLGTPWRAPLERRARALREAGLPVPIEPRDAALLFRLREGKKHALRWFEGTEELTYDDEPGARTQTELAAEVLETPDEFVAGALLRPILQDVVLPTAAYVGGWGELAYHLQLTELRRTLGVPLPPFVPRASATLVPPEARHALGQLDVELLDVLRAGGNYGEEDADGAGPPVVARLDALAEEVAKGLGALREELRALDPGLEGQIRRTADQVRGQLDKLAQKARRVHQTKSGRGRRHLRRVNHGLVPRGEPQERVRGALEFVARFGTAWIPQWIDLLDPLPTEHVVLDFVEDESA